ncbi:hypothetical protein TNCV_3972561 [Trichonephila clavipes]|nr:hypothetical protein TNCV_3972561 [Trichonephila clavipes]
MVRKYKESPPSPEQHFANAHPDYSNNFCIGHYVAGFFSTCNGVDELSGLSGYRVPSFQDSTAPLKTHCVEVLMYFKPVEVQSPRWRDEENGIEVASSEIVLIT